MAGRLDAKVAIITGGASGIGAATARLFAAEGAQVVIGDLNAAKAQTVAAEIEQAGGAAIGVQTDVTETTQVTRLVAASLERFGKVNILFANAGITLRGTAPDLPEETFDEVIAVNLRGPFLCAKYAIPAIIAAGGGSVIFTASSVALVGNYRGTAYCASKAGLIGMARAMALDHAHQGVRVNCICPASTDTPMLQRSIRTAPDPDAFVAAVIREIPVGRLGRPEDIAQAVLYLASDESTFVTGTALVVDGGFIAR
ncbi:MAG: SDR family oxidoreductase [Ardenticatenaceae bacterium]|nr:SDR family oxidoreductase [Ardenticatenaceae bacterium]HBY95155.1 short-chain dehydrogenase [Chloroflexota bacterium]